MQVNFTGIKNVGYEKRRYAQYVEPDENNPEEFFEVEDEHFLNLELSDDDKGNDLTELKNKIKTTNLNDYYHPIDPAMLNIAISKDIVTDYLGKTVDYQVYINDADKELEVSDQNLQFFSYLAKLINKVTNNPDNKFKVDRDYMSSKDAAVSVILGEDLEETYSDNYLEAIAEIYSPKRVKSGASEMNNLINEIMINYFNS